MARRPESVLASAAAESSGLPCRARCTGSLASWSENPAIIASGCIGTAPVSTVITIAEQPDRSASATNSAVAARFPIQYTWYHHGRPASAAAMLSALFAV